MPTETLRLYKVITAEGRLKDVWGNPAYFEPFVAMGFAYRCLPKRRKPWEMMRGAMDIYGNFNYDPDPEDEEELLKEAYPLLYANFDAIRRLSLA